MALLLYLYFANAVRSQSVNCLWSCFFFKLFCRPCWNKATPDNGWKKPCGAGLWQLLLSCKLCYFLLIVFFSLWLWNLAIIISARMSRIESVNLHGGKNSQEFYLQWPNYALSRIVKEPNVTKEKNVKVTKMKGGPKQTTNIAKVDINLRANFC